jgi:UDP-N-acetylmuramate dehydrogenase
VISLLPYNTFKIDAAAKTFYSVARMEDLFAIPPDERRQAYILGGGSNTLFVQRQVDTVLHVANKGIDVVFGDDGNPVLTVAAGEIWNDVVGFAVSKGWWGVENMIDIYGTVGGAAVQNIGAYGSEFKDVVVSVDVTDLISGDCFTLPAEECEYGYRSSIFKRKRQWLVWSVKLRLRIESAAVQGQAGASVRKSKEGGRSVSGDTPKEVAAQISALRSSKLPPLELYGSAGSFFKNPVITKKQYDEIRAQYPDLNGYPADNGAAGVKISAGWLIEKCGFKGACEGNVGVYEKQALVLINFGNAAGSEVFSLAQKIIATVKEKFNITLSPEVIVL